MKRLASPVAEYGLMGVLQVAGGLALAIVAAVSQGLVVAVVGLLLVGAFVGTWMYCLAYRRFVRRAVQEPAAAPSGEREPLNDTRRRVALITAALLLFMALVALLTNTPALVGGIAAGNGAALMATSRWLRSWEDGHHRTLLREPRWRWSRKDERGWGRGRGMMDPQDFYVLTPGAPAGLTL
jgi:hypothetical protein